MRTIKFRGKCVPDSKYAGEWVTGGLSQMSEGVTPHDEDLIVRFICGICTRSYHVIPDTVGQFTGLLDKDGCEIYEGDIVQTQFNKEPFGLVAWHPDGYFFIDTAFGTRESWCTSGFTPLGEFMRHLVSGQPIQLSIVGNVHDNPGLAAKSNAKSEFAGAKIVIDETQELMWDAVKQASEKPNKED